MLGAAFRELWGNCGLVATPATTFPDPSGMNTTNRKAAWAAAEAGKRRQQASALRAERIPSGNWRGVRRKMDALARLEREAAKFERIAGSDFIPDDECGPF